MIGPEKILDLLVEGFGSELGERVWAYLDPHLVGQRIYWARRASRRLVERSIYERVGKGRSVAAVAAVEGLHPGSVRRIVRRVLLRVRSKAA